MKNSMEVKPQVAVVNAGVVDLWTKVAESLELLGLNVLAFDTLESYEQAIFEQTHFSAVIIKYFDRFSSLNVRQVAQMGYRVSLMHADNGILAPAYVLTNAVLSETQLASYSREVASWDSHLQVPDLHFIPEQAGIVIAAMHALVENNVSV
jgi:hypothetical protein